MATTSGSRTGRTYTTRWRVRTYELSPERLKVAEDWLNDRRRLWESRLDRFDQYVKQLKDKESAP